MLKGSITLTTLIVMSSILLGGGISFILSTVDMRYVSNDSFDRSLLDVHVRTCLEEGVYRLTLDNTYTGSFDVDIDDKSCSVAITDTSPTVKAVAITGTYKNKNASQSYTVDISDSPYQVSTE